jgi:hypothetical protein
MERLAAPVGSGCRAKATVKRAFRGRVVKRCSGSCCPSRNARCTCATATSAQRDCSNPPKGRFSTPNVRFVEPLRHAPRPASAAGMLLANSAGSPSPKGERRSCRTGSPAMGIAGELCACAGARRRTRSGRGQAKAIPRGRCGSGRRWASALPRHRESLFPGAGAGLGGGLVCRGDLAWSYSCLPARRRLPRPPWPAGPLVRSLAAAGSAAPFTRPAGVACACADARASGAGCRFGSDGTRHATVALTGAMCGRAGGASPRTALPRRAPAAQHVPLPPAGA